MPVKIYTYILQGEIYEGKYKGIYQSNRSGMEAIFNLGISDAIVISAQNLEEMSKIFFDRFEMELKGSKLDGDWWANIPGTKSHAGYFKITRR